MRYSGSAVVSGRAWQRLRGQARQLRGYMKVTKEAVRGALCRRVGVLACEDGDSLVEKEAEVMETFHKHNTVIL